MSATTVAIPMSVDPRVSLTFAKRERTNTIWIEGEYPVDARPDALFAAFEAAGWLLDPVHEGIPACEAYDFDYSKPMGQQMVRLGYQVKSFVLSKSGTALFNGQTDDEARAFKTEARRVLRRFGFTRVPTWAKTLTDML